MASSKGNTMVRVKGILGFFIGVFGAMAILGVFFKIMKFDNYDFFMKVGFIGEAAAFIVMGVLELIGSFASSTTNSTATPTTHGLVHDSSPSSFGKAVDAKLDARLDEMLVHFSSDIDRFRGEMNALSDEIASSRSAVSHMRSNLEQLSTADLAGDAERMGKGMAILGSEMASAGSAVGSMRSDLDQIAQRFKSFNSVPMASGHMPSYNGKVDKPPIGRSVA